MKNKVNNSSPQRACLRPCYLLPPLQVPTLSLVGGFPQVKGRTHETIRAHVAPATLSLWDDHAGPAVIAFSPSNRGEVDPPKVISFHDLLCDCLGNPNIFIQVPDLNRNIYTEHKPVLRHSECLPVSGLVSVLIVFSTAILISPP